ncbi:threonine aldolase family protein [Roseiterribacter gracilis]|uniref:Threonine aldolase n=1 Tax=Roseiterribacter gracilis TaxID=2812848 RepID=A0A8S8X7X8_9PROT|nr:threonine aldolase [Rhodospirillales bacterium TMPK1]
MQNRLIDLYSDTQTRPSAAMRAAMAAAEVGDEQRGEDPTINSLCARVAELLGQEDAVFLPSGTMANEISLLVHCRPGDEVLADRSSHILNSEGGAPAALAGAQITPLPGVRGVFTAADVRAAIREPSRYAPVTRVVSFENTANFGGGTVWPLDVFGDAVKAARDGGCAVHLDGARLLNAAVAAGQPAAAWASHCDSVWIDFSKGLGCPVGAALAGSKAFIEQAWRWKQRMGGAMRQAGILGAAALYALDHNVDRLADDHRAAKALADGLAALPGVRVESATNIVFFDVTQTGFDAPSFAARMLTRGVRVAAFSADRCRAVTHHDVAFDDMARVVEAARDVLQKERAA